jgi:hypothetical protein
VTMPRARVPRHDAASIERLADDVVRGRARLPVMPNFRTMTIDELETCARKPTLFGKPLGSCTVDECITLVRIIQRAEERT